MCSCMDIDFGSYSNQITLEVPKHVQTPAMKRGDKSPLVDIDVCLVSEIKKLWKQGIKTDESCCGHNKAPAYIAVCDQESQRKMRKMGYEDALQNPHKQGYDKHIIGRKDIFSPKTL